MMSEFKPKILNVIPIASTDELVGHFLNPVSCAFIMFLSHILHKL